MVVLGDVSVGTSGCEIGVEVTIDRDGNGNWTRKAAGGSGK